MPAVWTINDQALVALGVADFSITRSGEGPVSLTLLVNQPIAEASSFAYGDTVTVKKDAATWFVGKVVTPTDAAEWTKEGYLVRCENAWWDLTRNTYLLTWPVGAVRNPGTTTGRRQLFVGVGTDEPETTQEAMQAVLDQAVDRGLISGYSGLSVLGEVTPPREAVVDRTYAEVILAILAYHVEVSIYWDGDQLKLSKRGVDTETFAHGDGRITGLSLSRREDLVPEGVVIRYEREEGVQRVSGWRGIVTDGDDVWPEGTNIDDVDVLVQTITLRKDEPLPDGIAKRYYEMLEQAIAEGTITIKDQDCDQSVRPGTTINITGGKAWWADMNAFVQQVTEQPMLGLTTVTVGLPARLDAQSLYDLVRNMHRIMQRDGNASADVDVFTEPSGALSGYVTRVGPDVVFRVSPGVISTGETSPTDHIPLWELSSTPLNASSPPGSVVVEGNAFDYYLYAEVNPVPELFTFSDADGDPVVEYRAIGPCEAVALRIVFSDAAAGVARAPVVDPETGEVTMTGKYYFHMGTFSWPVGGSPTVSPTREGSFYLLHVPPNRVLLISM
jgi:hypothetical protein